MIYNIKEICGCCNKNILIGHRFLECNHCQGIIHKKCFTESKFIMANRKCLCPTCQTTVTNSHKYNPFRDISAEEFEGDCEEDKFYADNFSSTFDCIQNASRVLENCSRYNSSELHQLFPMTVISIQCSTILMAINRILILSQQNYQCKRYNILL